MDTETLIEQASHLRTRIQRFISQDGQPNIARGAKSQVCEFLRKFAGDESDFYRQAEEVQGHDGYQVVQLTAIMDSFIDYLTAGLHSEISPQRMAQIDVVSDFMEQAQELLRSPKCHPAAAAVLAGGALEEFLRNWVEAENLMGSISRPSIDTYSRALRSKELVTKQDTKDITSWAGTRNHAAHGEWDQVSDQAQIRLMLEGVNLFMRKHGT